MIDRDGHLILEIPETELWDPVERMFRKTHAAVLVLEHSLHSISVWESKWKIPFLSSADKSQEQTMDYIRCMTINDVDAEVFKFLPSNSILEVNRFLNDTMTATFFYEKRRPPQDKRPVTSELIYYWMIELGIPLECEHWNINRLMTLIKVCNEESKPQQQGKFRASDAVERRNLNRMRQRKLKTGG